MAGSLSVRQRNAAAERKRRFAARQAELSRNNAGATQNVRALGTGFASIPGRVFDYFKNSTPLKVNRDLGSVARSTFKAMGDNPNAFIQDSIASIPAGLRDFGDVRAMARRLRAQGRTAEAEKMEAMAGVAALGVIPIVGRVPGNVARTAIKAGEKALVKGAVKAPALKAPDITVTPKPKASKPKAATPPATGKKPLAAKTEAPPAPKRKSVANTFEGVTDYDVAMNLAREGEHLKQGKGGQYAGAPRDVSGTGENLTVDSPEALELMRANLDQKAKEGLFNASWYDRSRGTGADLSGFDMTDYSPENLATPEANMASLFARGTAA